MKNRVFTLLGLTNNTENFGVRVLLSSALDCFSSIDPAAKIQLLDYGRSPASFEEETANGRCSFTLVNLRFSWRVYLRNNVFVLFAFVLLTRLLPRRLRLALWRCNRATKAISDSTAAFAISGGDSFSDIYGIVRFLYVALPQLLVLLLDRPLVLLPQTYGPFRTKVARLVSRFILRRAICAFTRDSGEEPLGTESIVTRELISVPDIGLGMAAGELPKAVVAKIELLKGKGTVVGLNVSKLLYMGGYSRKNMFALRCNFPELVSSLINLLVKNHNGTVLLVPHVCGGFGSEEDETSLCQELMEKFRSFGDRLVYIQEPLNHRQVKSLIGQCDVFIGARMHACVAAVSQQVPTVCLAYSGKFKGVMQPLGAGACVVDLRTEDVAQIVAKVEITLANRHEYRRMLHETMGTVRNRLNRDFVGRLSTIITELSTVVNPSTPPRVGMLIAPDAGRLRRETL